MSATGYTTIYNEVLRDSTLSLDAKGLFAVIKSFVGLPDFALSKRRLSYACSDSGYLLNAAWKELKQKGYLQHYFSQSENGAFCHVYNLMQHPSAPVDFVYSPSIDRPNGDVICISDAQRDYTNISTAVLRDKSISLASKGLFALVSHLMKIPGFVLRPEGIRSFCMEKIKHFSTLWKRFKISGLLKQHRHPAGEENRWTYEYEICETPDLETPYLTNYHVDGSVSTIATIGDFLEVIKPLFGREREKKELAKVFQALRIEVNQEMEALKEMLLAATEALKPGGRLVVITYHSLEDRMVKNIMKTGNVEGKAETDFFGNLQTPFRLVNNKVIVPDEAEIERNPRSRSAKLRIAEKK